MRIRIKKIIKLKKLYLHDKNNKKIFGILKCGEVYIIDRIIKDFDESAFKIIIHNYLFTEAVLSVIIDNNKNEFMKPTEKMFERN